MCNAVYQLPCHKLTYSPHDNTYQIMMNVRSMRTFAPTVVQSGQHVEQIIEHVTDTDTYDEHDYAHTYELEPAESEV